ncbi:MAG: RNA methyltransferase [Rickettsiaceae bacterium]|nr:RNA methyltransferase [Rickettsiaceae bacterium]
MNKNISIILAAPQMGENIGAAARAMKNFGLHDLRIVSPRDGWPNEKARANAALAVDVVDDARVFESIKDAVSDLNYLYATTSATRAMNKDYVVTKNLLSAFPDHMNVGIIFGRESTGLTNEEISIANKIITIDTDPGCASLNLAQAVLIVCYELFGRNERADIANTQDLCTISDMTYFLDHLFNELSNTGFFKTEERREIMMRNITNIFTRIPKLSHNEVQTLRGVISHLTKG